MPPAPLDARLVPSALGGWVAAYVAVAHPARWSVVFAALVLLFAMVPVHHLVRERRRARRRTSPQGATGPASPQGATAPRARHRGIARRPPAAAALLTMVVVAAVLGATAAQVEARTAGVLGELVSRGASAVVTGRVVAEPRTVASREWETTERFRVVVDVEEVAGRGARSAARATVVVLGPASWGGLALGEQVRVRGTLVATDPGDDALALLVTTHEPERLGPPPWHLRSVNLLRGALRAATADLSPQARGLVPGIAVGDDRELPDDLRTDMQAVSLTHLTAVSGAHVAILLGSVLGAFVWLPRRWRTAAGAAALVAFVALVRPEPSVLRSAVMGAVVLLALVLGRPARALPALCASVVALLLVDPWLARSYGFVLSVLATAGLVLLARPWARWLSHLLPRWLATAVAVPAAAQAACGPVVVLLTPALSVYAVPANLLAAPAVPPATVLGVGATVVAPWWPEAAQSLATAASWCTAWIAVVARVLAAAPGAQVAWPGGTGGAVALAAATAVGVVLLARAGPRRARPALLAAAVVIPLALAGPRLAPSGLLPDSWPPRGWAAVQCDVGQGAAFLVRSGPGAAVMVDVGPAGAGAAACLRDAGVESLDLLVLTHAHADHVGGLAEVLAAVDVRRALLGPGPEPASTVEVVLKQLAAAGVAVERPVAGTPTASGSAGEVGWQVLGPDAAAVGAAAGGDGAVNDLSLVVGLDAPGLRAVALGDVELDGQARLVRRLRQAQMPPYDVVVMAHHGSARQDERLPELLAPRLTVVSVGLDNDYGHPSAAAVDLYAGAGPVLRTDLCGQVAVVRTDSAAGLATLAGCPAGHG